MADTTVDQLEAVIDCLDEVSDALTDDHGVDYEAVDDLLAAISKRVNALREHNEALRALSERPNEAAPR